jgi:putative transposase
MDLSGIPEIYVKVKEKCRYYHRAVDKEKNTIDFLLISKRDTKAALRFFNKVIGRNGKPGLINIDKSGTSKAGINQFNDGNNRRVKIRQCKYLNNIIEQDHRPIKRITRLMLGFKRFRAAQNSLKLRKSKAALLFSTTDERFATEPEMSS